MFPIQRPFHPPSKRLAHLLGASQDVRVTGVEDGHG